MDNADLIEQYEAQLLLTASNMRNDGLKDKTILFVFDRVIDAIKLRIGAQADDNVVFSFENITGSLE